MTLNTFREVRRRLAFHGMGCTFSGVVALDPMKRVLPPTDRTNWFTMERDHPPERWSFYWEPSGNAWYRDSLRTRLYQHWMSEHRAEDVVRTVLHFLNRDSLASTGLEEEFFGRTRG